MLNAHDQNGIEVNIRSVRNPDGSIMREGYYCTCCRESVNVAFGDKRQYFRHKRNNSKCIANKYDKVMTPWHYEWQSLFPDGTQEHYETGSDGAFRRADVLFGNTVVEFQHSQLSDEEVRDRTEFYENQGRSVIWVFDFRSRWSVNESFNKANYTILGQRAIKLKCSGEDLILPTGIRLIDTNRTGLFAEVSDDNGEVVLLRLIRHDFYLLAVNEGYTREGFANAIVDNTLQLPPIDIKEIPDPFLQKKNRDIGPEQQKQADEALSQLRAITTAENNVQSITSTSFHELKMLRNKPTQPTAIAEKQETIGEPERAKPEQGKKHYVIISNRSPVDMIVMIKPFLERIDCRITYESHDDRLDEFYAEYTIEAPERISDRYILNYLTRLATKGYAPLYGGHFSLV